MPIENLNWMSYEDIENLLVIEGFEIIFHGKRILFPRRFPIFYRLFNKLLAPLPLINQACLNGYSVG